VPTSNCGVAGDATTQSQGCSTVRDSNWCHQKALYDSPSQVPWTYQSCMGSGSCNYGSGSGSGYYTPQQFAGDNVNPRQWGYIANQPNGDGTYNNRCIRSEGEMFCGFVVEADGSTTGESCAYINVSVSQ
jgi:hypothetical protein